MSPLCPSTRLVTLALLLTRQHQLKHSHSPRHLSCLSYIGVSSQSFAFTKTSSGLHGKIGTSSQSFNLTQSSIGRRIQQQSPTLEWGFTRTTQGDRLWEIFSKGGSSESWSSLNVTSSEEVWSNLKRQLVAQHRNEKGAVGHAS